MLEVKYYLILSRNAVEKWDPEENLEWILQQKEGAGIV